MKKLSINQSEKQKNKSHNFEGCNGYKLKYFAFLTKPNKKIEAMPTKLYRFHPINRAFKIFSDQLLFGKKFKKMRLFDVNHGEDEWSEFRECFMDTLVETATKKNVFNELILIFALFENVWNLKQSDPLQRLSFRWPFKESNEEKVRNEMNKIGSDQIVCLLKELFSKKSQNQSEEALRSAFYDEYFGENEAAINKGPGFGRSVYSYLNRMDLNFDLVQSENESDCDDDDLKAALKEANNGKIVNDKVMIANVDNRESERDKFDFVINAMLKNKAIRISINECLAAKNCQKQKKHFAVLRNIEKAMDGEDGKKYHPKNNENLYLLTHKKGMRTFAAIENCEKEVLKKENADSVYGCFGFAHFGYSELGTIDDIKSQFVSSPLPISIKKFCVLKICNLQSFKGWNAWTIVDDNNNFDDSMGKLYRCMIGPHCIVPVRKKCLKIKKNGKKKAINVDLFECYAYSHQRVLDKICNVINDQ